MSVGSTGTTNPLVTKAWDEAMKTAENANARKNENLEEYEAAMEQYNIFRNAKNQAYNKYKAAQAGNDVSAIKAAKASYASACSSYTEADNLSDALNAKALDSIFYAGKMNNMATVAKSILA